MLGNTQCQRPSSATIALEEGSEELNAESLRASARLSNEASSSVEAGLSCGEETSQRIDLAHDRDELNASAAEDAHPQEGADTTVPGPPSRSLILSPTQSLTIDTPHGLFEVAQTLAFRLKEVLNPRQLDVDRHALKELLDDADALAQTLRDPRNGELEAPKAREFDAYFQIRRKVPGGDALVIGIIQAVCELVTSGGRFSQADRADILNGFGVTLSLLSRPPERSSKS